MDLFQGGKKTSGKRFLLVLPVAVLGLVFSLVLTHTSRSFHDFTEDLFCSELAENTLSMHYTVANPEDFGIKNVEAKLPVYETGNSEKQRQLLEEYLSFLQNTDVKRLNKSDKYTYELLLSYFENEYSAKDYFYYDEPLGASSGMQTQLPILLAEYTFRSKQDVEDYLKLLEQTDKYFEGLLTYEQEKSGAGLFMSDTALKKVIAQCDSIMDSSLLESNSHFLQTTFSERLSALKEQGLLTDEEIKAYEAENHRLLTTVMAPAYTALGDGLMLLSGTGKNTGGLAGFANGKEYYTYLIKRDVGSYRDMNDIKTIVCEDFDKNLQTLVTVTTENPELLSHASDGHFDEILPFDNAESMLDYLQKRMVKDFPSLSKPVTYSIKNISDSLAEYSSPAFYLTPPLDDIDDNVIYLNPTNNYGRLDLFTTLAHEGYPGHLFQCVYYNSNSAAKKNPVRSLLGYTGYAEGYALYVELISYDYASELALSAGEEDAAQYYQILKTDRQVQLGLYSLLDIAIHYDGADYTKVKNFLSSMGIKDENSCQAVYEYIVEEPANYLKYYLGYLEILSLKEKAAKEWGTDYTDYEFHKFFLDAGPSDFQSLESLLDK